MSIWSRLFHRRVLLPGSRGAVERRSARSSRLDVLVMPEMLEERNVGDVHCCKNDALLSHVIAPGAVSLLYSLHYSDP